jgi:lipopolysaccharide/colanic/teichoic acid biosynthesis glycosyltransferase
LVAVKRALDVVVSALALALLSPVLALVAILVRITMGTPVLFRQTRAGRHGEPFELLKFRTMRPARPGDSGPEHDMGRITTLGRFLRRTSLDELPSLLNVLSGEMSLVGPRPLPMQYTERYTDEQRRRLDVPPGLTGWAVVNGRNHLPWEERFALDCWYVEHRSFVLDLRILWRTVAIVVSGKDVNHSEGVTMTEFRGDEQP